MQNRMAGRDELFSLVYAHCPQVEHDKVRAIFARLDDEYLAKFDPPTIARHVQAMVKLSNETPVEVILQRRSAEQVECTIVAFDHPFEFSSIAGLMAGTGFSIESSDAFTLASAAQPPFPPRPKARKTTLLRQRDPISDSVIVDWFCGRLIDAKTSFSQWSKTFESAIVQVMKLLDQQDEHSTERAKRLVNERVTQWLKSQRRASPATGGPAPIDVQIEQLPHGTRLKLQAPDAPAFLYALSTALSLHGLQILQLRVRTVDGRAVDQIDLADERGKPLQDPDRVQQIRLSVLLTHQFAYFLDRSPDPFTSLQRFEELSEKIVKMPQRRLWLKLLSEPQTMSDLAKILGASDYLWEDFIRLNADALLPVLERRLRGLSVCPPSRSLPRRLEQTLSGAENFEQQRNLLNQFKDHELFLIDLDHILSSENQDETFQILSQRLVLLAENLVATASRLVHQELVRLYGKPQDPEGKPCGFAVFGLGKLGGVALGYASDIELLFLYDSDGQTTGGTRGSLTNGEFFAILTRQTCDYIQAKREGIFEVDLRLRPYGKDGPLACSRQQFAEYYSESGPAHPFERLALVRLRWIAGDAALGFQIEQLRDRILYEGSPLDLNAIWDIWEKMHAQHAKPGRLNSKYSSGALADLEGTVQLLQVMHAREAPQLRTPRIHEAIEGLRRAGVLTPVEFDELTAAYQFMRRLINAQRVLRGSAQDLFLPDEGSDELVHLARRMNYLPEEPGGDIGAMLLSDFKKHTQAVKRFVRSRFGRPCPGK